MKRIFFLIACEIVAIICFSQNVGIGTTTPNSNAALEIKSNNKGLLMPRTSTATKNSIANVPQGMLLYDSSFSAFYYHDGYKWRHIGEKNFDGVLTDYSNNPVITVNMGGSSSTTALSGILYDNGGPAGNYAANSNNSYTVNRSATATDSVVGFKVVIEEMNLESPYDSIEISSGNQHKTVITGTTTGTYYFSGSDILFFKFRSNGVNQLSGFKIVWSVLVASNTLIEEPPLYGWYFNTKKLAMRGGLRNGNEWSTDSLGKFSFAYGFDAKASGYSSVSFMSGKATGAYSAAIGGGAYATGDYSFSVGYGGFIPNWASGAGSIAMGGGNISYGDNSIAMGYLSNTDGAHSVAIGDENQAWAIRAVALGSHNAAHGNYSLALGNYTDAKGYYSTSMGYHSTASGDTSFASGYNTVASGNTSTAMGYQTTASGVRSTSMGHNTTASGSYSTSMGYETISRGFAGTVVGMYNEPILGTAQGNPTTNTPLFIVGNGSSGATSNAMVVLKSGNTGIGTDAPRTKLHIDGGTDASLSDNSGFVIIGNEAATNLVFDNNEIMARNNGATATLFLQNSGGAFEIGGTAAKPGGGSWAATSDARLKQNVKPYNDGLQQLLKINPVYYQYNQLSGYDTKKQYIGVVAQELKEITPYMVGTFTKNNTEYYNVDNGAMTYMLINAVKELSKQNDELKARLEKLEAAILKK